MEEQTPNPENQEQESISPKEKMILEFETLLKSEDVESIAKSVKELTTSLNAIFRREKEEQLDKFVKEGGLPEFFEVQRGKVYSRYKELANLFQDRYDKVIEEQKRLEKLALETKEKLVAELQDLVENEQRIGKSFERFAAIRDEWKAAGQVHSKAYQELQRKYRSLLERFFYNIEIYKDLRAHDFKKNLENRKELIARLQHLEELNSIYKIEHYIRQYQDEWDEMGPVAREDWLEVRDEFGKTLDRLYGRIREHYQKVRDQHAENLKAKEKLCELVETLAESESESVKEWQERSQEVVELRQQWKKIGFANKKDNDAVWDRFKAANDSFFNAKKAFFDRLKDKRKENEEKKKSLIDELDKIKDNEHFKETTEKIIALQKKWKEVQSAGRKEDQKLWQQFRASCDYFFDRKRSFFQEVAEAAKENLANKLKLLEELKNFTLSGNPGKDIAELKKFSTNWREAGSVPPSQRRKLNDDFNKVLNSFYNQIKMDSSEKAAMQYQLKLERLSSSQNSRNVLRKERDFVRDKIRELQNTVAQYENNLEFFGPSNSTKENPFKKEVEKKMKRIQSDISAMQDKLKMVADSLKNAQD